MASATCFALRVVNPLPECRPKRVPALAARSAARVARLLALVTSAAALAAGCYEHHERLESFSSCPLPRIIGPESGRAGARCDDCVGASGGRAAPFVVRGNVAYRHALDLEIIDISEPREPVLIRNVATMSPRAGSLALTGRVLIVGGAFAELYDLIDPVRPRYLSSLRDTTVGFVVVARGSLAAVASPIGSGYSLSIWDLSDPSAPESLSTLHLVSEATLGHMAFGDGTVWLVTSLGERTELLGIDVRDPRAPTITSTTTLAAPPSPGGVTRLSFARPGLLLCGSLGEESGARIRARYFVAGAGSPVLRAAHSSGPCGLLVSGDRSVATLRDARGVPSIALFDLTTAVAPTELGHAPHAGEAEHAAIAGNALLVSNPEGLLAYPLGCD